VKDFIKEGINAGFCMEIHYFFISKYKLLFLTLELLTTRMRLLLFTILIIATTTPCPSFASDDFDFAADTTKLTGKDSAVLLFDQALNLMRTDYYEKNSIGWESLVTEAKSKLAVANTCSDSYAIIEGCFNKMKANHSFIIPLSKTAAYANDTSCSKRKPLPGEMMGEIKGSFADKDIAYLSVPWVCTTNPVICTMVADSLQKLIATLDEKGISKWIIDLRMNKGGNCWPMLAGIGPLIGNNLCGYFVLSNSKAPISYREGNAMNGNKIICGVSGKAYTTKKTQKYIAVLVGPNTSSSGELVALAFKGLPNTALFGEPTAGFTTANTSFDLLDKSMLVLTVGMEADRGGHLCYGKIIPDEIITATPAYPTDDPVKTRATMWLQLF
jgi:hypothetical protein